MNLTPTPHNGFFYQVMSRKDKAWAFFERYRSKPILDIADLTQLELVESKHITDAGLSLYNDILYRCSLGGSGRLLLRYVRTPIKIPMLRYPSAC